MKTALFDMDGTLFAGDSQLRFCRWVLRRHGWRRLYLLLMVPCGILRGLGIFNTERMKRAFLAYAWGMSTDRLEQYCRDFVEQELLPAIYPPVLERLRAHQQAGDITILCSASPDCWTRLVGQALGFSLTIGTPLQTFRRLPFMPTIPPPGNNKGANKLVRLAEKGITHADIGYTDSAADLPMLSICDHAVLINPRRDFAALLPEAEILTPPKNLPSAFILRCVTGI